MANGRVEACWLRQLLLELHASLTKSTLVYRDNVSVVYLSTNLIKHQRIKHVEIGLHFMREHVAIGDVHVLHVSMTSQFVDIFTKGLPLQCFRSLAPVSTFKVAIVLTARGVEICCIINT
jgi:hypothetical protein